MDKLKIEKINFDDSAFLSLIKKYCLQSAPFGEIDHLNSIKSRNKATERYIDFLKQSCGFCVCCKDVFGDYIFFAFFKPYKKSSIELVFAFPNTEKSNDISILRRSFYNLCLEAISEYNIDTIKGKIFRRNKKNNYKIFLKRYIKAIKYTENEDKNHDFVYLDKESILKHREKLKIQGNWY